MDTPGASAWVRSPTNDSRDPFASNEDPPFSSMMSDLHGGSAPFVPFSRRERDTNPPPSQESSIFTEDLRSIMSDFAPGIDPLLAPGGIGHGVIGANRRSEPGPSSSRLLPPGRTSVYEPIGGLALPLPLGIPDGSGARSCWSAVVDTERNPPINSVAGSVDSRVDDSMERELMCLLSEDNSPSPVVSPQAISNDQTISTSSTANEAEDKKLLSTEDEADTTMQAREQERQQTGGEDVSRRYKTKRCQFAHGAQELRPSVDSDTTSTSSTARPSRDSQGDRPRVCWNWANSGTCKFGSACTYASTHTSENLGASVAVPVCRFWSSKGYCPYDTKCNLASTHKPENMPPESEREIPSAADFVSLPRRSNPGERPRNSGEWNRPSTESWKPKPRNSIDSLSSKGTAGAETADNQAGDEDMPQLLEKPSAQPEVDLNARSIDLFKAAGFGSVQRVQGLMDQNADPNVGVVHGRTPLMQAASWGHVECVSALIAGRADVCAKDPGGKTAIFLAQVHNQANCIEVIQQALLQQLAYVCANGGVDQMQALVDCGADVNTIHIASGQFPLSVAAARKDPQMVIALLQIRTVSNARVRVDAVDRSTGMTALSHAARASNHGAVQALLEANADPRIADAQSRTALWHAQQTNNVKCAKLLQAADKQQAGRRQSSTGEGQSSKDKRRTSVNPAANDKDKNSFATLLDQEDSPGSQARRGCPQKAPVTADSSSEEEEEVEEEEVVRPSRRVPTPNQGANNNKNKNHKGKNSKNSKGGRLREPENLNALKAENNWMARWTNGWILEGQMSGIGLTQLSMLAACIISVIYITRDVVLHLADLEHITIGGPGEVCVRMLSGSCGVVMIHLCVSLLFPLLGH